MKNNNIILAGVARSGSTLSCHLLNKLPDTVALHEPIHPHLVPLDLESHTIGYVQDFFNEQRSSILNKGIAKSKSKNGKVPDNPMGGVDEKTGKRIRVLDGSEIKVAKSLDENFNLVIKQPGLFTGMLSVFNQDFPCYATIRNPLAVLGSWNTVDMAVTDGHAPAAEQCDPSLKASLAAEPDRFNRQVLLLSWYYEQFFKYVKQNNIIYYEEVIVTGGKALSCISPSASCLDEKLMSKNNNYLYDSSIKDQLASHLLNFDGFYWKYYSRKEVGSLIKDTG